MLKKRGVLKKNLLLSLGLLFFLLVAGCGGGGGGGGGRGGGGGIGTIPGDGGGSFPGGGGGSNPGDGGGVNPGDGGGITPGRGRIYTGTPGDRVVDPVNSYQLGFGPENLENKLTAAQNNDVTIDYTNLGSNTLTGSAYGAYRNDAVAVANNKLTIKNGQAHSAYGGYSQNGEVTRNEVAISGGILTASAYGGFSQNGGVFENTVTMNSGIVSTNNGNVGIHGGYSQMGNASRNQVFMNGGRSFYVYGGYSGHALLSSTGSANDNTVTITGGRVTLSEININSLATIAGGYSKGGSATGNSVTISGGTFIANIYGGYVNQGTGAASGNSITISGSPDLTKSNLIGGHSAGGSVTGNTLNIHSKNLTVNKVQNFSNYNFYLPANIGAGETMLRVTEATDISNSTIGVGIPSGPALQVGETVTLLHSQGGLTATGINGMAVGLQGIAKIYDFNLTTDGNKLYAQALPPPPGAPVGPVAGRLNPRVTSLVNGRAAGLAHIVQGADLVAGPGMKSALAAAGNPAGAFTAFGGGQGHPNHRTGSNLDMESASVLSGMSRQKSFASGNLLLGSFFETGWGDYSSRNSFSNAASVKAKGTTRYSGGGFLGRMEHTSGTYLDASLRAGRLTTDYRTGDLISGLGERADYETSSAYYGLHTGLGFFWQATEHASFDFSAKYFWTHQEGAAVTIAGDRFRFQSENSRRLRSGVGFTYALSDTISTYVGAYYEYEFGGQAGATVNSLDIDTPDLSGSTGLGELGLTWTSSGTTPFSLRLGLQGHTGVQDGLAGNLHLKLDF